eukprot:CAMPEP_0184871596 /NCGR_PEP_ID=MMETSP0580-20130426/40812_1 /TAXON_ID=1118495 /ORGANISM="Dactyliosolen fragilissimus" /LENGTH=209 /DNA_ID=CAMNT_0027374279 /DNA_START=596 /DNA_END=1222 /DNA_ORIENTATION=-
MKKFRIKDVSRRLACVFVLLTILSITQFITVYKIQMDVGSNDIRSSSNGMTVTSMNKNSASIGDELWKADSIVETENDILKDEDKTQTYNNDTTTHELKFAICAWVRNEAPYMAKWIEHHALIGFDSLLLYNDHSTDDTQCVLDAYAEKGLVKRIPEDIGEEYNIIDGATLSHQGEVFDTCRKYLRDLELQSNNTKWWMLTNDPDEFVW